MSKFFIFAFLWYILGSPFLALLVLLLVLYFLDRRFIGLMPSLVKPIKRMRQTSRLREELRLNPHYTSAKHELARLLMERKRYREAAELLEQVKERTDESDDLNAELAICYLHLGRSEGPIMLEKVLEGNPRVKYGEPLLILGRHFSKSEPERAIQHLRQFQEVHASSVQGHYRLGQIFEALDRQHDAKSAFREAQEIYRSLPKYKRKSERRWFILSMLKTLGKSK